MFTNLHVANVNIGENVNISTLRMLISCYLTNQVHEVELTNHLVVFSENSLSIDLDEFFQFLVEDISWKKKL